MMLAMLATFTCYVTISCEFLSRHSKICSHLTTLLSFQHITRFFPSEQDSVVHLFVFSNDFLTLNRAFSSIFSLKVAHPIPFLLSSSSRVNEVEILSKYTYLLRQTKQASVSPTTASYHWPFPVIGILVDVPQYGSAWYRYPDEDVGTYNS